MVYRVSELKFYEMKTLVKINKNWKINHNSLIYVPKNMMFILDKRVKGNGFLESKK